MITGKVLVLFVSLLHVKCLYARPSKHKRQQKKYVIEVQDHQQAMKYADPMVDLEETVRRGINDPLNDPNFIMNQVNQDFFHQNFAHDTSIYRGALPRQTIQTSMHSSAHVFDLTPQRVVTNNAVKNNMLARRLSRFPNLIPKRPVQENAGKMGTIPHPAPLINVLKSLLLASKRNNNNMNNFFINNNPNRNQIKENVNALTGLPEDLEAKSYGAITSIESVSDQPAHQMPQTVTVNIDSAAVRRNQAKPFVNKRARTKNFKRPDLDVSTEPSVIAGTIGSNYDTIKSFLEADNILRKKFTENSDQNFT